MAHRSRAATVAAGILSSRMLGFVRERAVAHYLGVTGFTDALTTAFRGPNLLQVLLGEQTLSAAFIPVYSQLLEEGRKEEAGRFAGAVFGLLLAAAATLSLAGVLLARPLVAILAAGYLKDAAAVAAGEATVDRYELAVLAVRWVFPMMAFLVLSAWALGVLNSHRRFFWPYFSPVLWNASIIAALVLAAGGLGAPWCDPEAADHGFQVCLLIAACIGALVGGILQFAVQLPLVFRLMKGFRFSFSTRVVGVRRALAAFGPAVAGRGVVQLSLYLDQFLASLAAVGAVSAIRWGSFLYALPISLFGMSIAASELPAMSRLERGGGELPRRVEVSLRRMAFLVLPSAVGYVFLGFLLVGAIYRTGEFTLEDNWLIYLVLAAYSLGLPASTASRLLQNLFFALGDTRTPARIAAQRVVLSGGLGAFLMFWLDAYAVGELVPLEGPVRGLFLGAVGLALGSAAGSWLEILRLRQALSKPVPEFRLPVRALLPMLGLAFGSLVPACLLWKFLPSLPVVATALLVVGTFAAAYLLLSVALGLPEAKEWLEGLRRRLRR
ncbi:MAG: murein biosynthesis integral membrane protein MurJ [Acidobacteria bacterium]|nr:murein biosynthesis integral membrane protein MurJ [Acidobacteriota bacterium]